MGRLGKFLPLALLMAMTWGAESAQDDRWAGFYDRETLLYWQGQTPPGIEDNFRSVIWPVLTPEEKRVLGRVELNFPLELPSHPMNFFASTSGGRKFITLPISSLRFFGDLALAYVWLNDSGYSIQPVSDYLAMLKYQWPRELMGHKYRPREVLGVPENATANQRIADHFQQVYGTAIVFILGHELGHIYYGHRRDPLLPPDVSQRQEEEADRFGLEIMRRIGDTPIGVIPFFFISAHLEANEGNSGGAESSRTATHPLSSSRLRSLASALNAFAPDFTRTGSQPAAVQRIAAEVNEIANKLDDAGVQDHLRDIGRAARPESLGPRKPGDSLAPPARVVARTDQPFSGAYRGKWRDAKGVDFDVTMNLTRQGNMVRGEYRFGEGQVTSTVTIQGLADGNELSFNWKWGTQYFGKGVLKHDSSGGKLTGTWGYTQADSGAGTWELYRTQ